LKARPVPSEPQEQAAPLGRYDVQQKKPNPSEQPLRLGVEALISLRGRRRCNTPSSACGCQACACGEVSGKSAARADEIPAESKIKAAKTSTNRKNMNEIPPPHARQPQVSDAISVFCGLQENCSRFEKQPVRKLDCEAGHLGLGATGALRTSASRRS
jgi:hypothetical protein